MDEFPVKIHTAFWVHQAGQQLQLSQVSHSSRPAVAQWNLQEPGSAGAAVYSNPSPLHTEEQKQTGSIFMLSQWHLMVGGDDNNGPWSHASLQLRI